MKALTFLMGCIFGLGLHSRGQAEEPVSRHWIARIGVHPISPSPDSHPNFGIDNATGSAGGDFGTDGLDHATLGTVGVVDDSGEFDTSPYYAAPLRGIRVTIRVYEPNSKQIREAVVIQNFDTK